MDTLKSQSNEPLHSNTVIGIRYTGSWWVGCYIRYSEEGPGQATHDGQCSQHVDSLVYRTEQAEKFKRKN